MNCAMRKIGCHLLNLIMLGLLASLSNCDPNNHAATDHPCNFPDADTENNLRGGKWYKIIDKTTSINLVDTTSNAIIHRDSVILYNDNLEIIPSSYEFHIDNWIFKNLKPYEGVPFNDPQALLDLKERTFYLRTAYDDYDTIRIIFRQCLTDQVIFNGQANSKPINDPHSGSTSYYFKK